MEKNDHVIHEEDSLTEIILMQKRWLFGMTVISVITALFTVYMAVFWYQDKDNRSVRLLYCTITCFAGLLLLACIICIVLCSKHILKNREIINSGLLRTEGTTVENCRREWRSFTTGAASVLSRLTKTLLMVLLPAAGLLTLHLLYGETAAASTSQSLETDETETASDIFTEAKKYKDFLLTSDSDHLYEEVPAYYSAEEWMKNRTIAPRVLYEDDQYKLELTGYSIREGNLLIETEFTNNSEKRVFAGAVSGSVYINDMVTGVYLTNNFGMETNGNVLPGSTGGATFTLPADSVSTLDPLLKKLEFRLGVWERTRTFYPNSLLLSTDPIIIYTQSDDRQDPETDNAEEYELISEPGMKILYESDELRVVGRGIRGQLYDNEGEYVIPAPDFLFTSTTWKFLVENRTDHEIVVDHLACNVNGEKALSSIMDEEWLEIPDPEHNVLNEYYEVEFNRIPKAIDAGRRREFYFSLKRAENADEIEGEETSEDVRRVERMLDEIQTASAEFVINYTNSAGETQQVQIVDEYVRPDN